MPAERAMLEAALDRLAVDLRGLADTLPRIDALEAYLDLARPLVDECEGRDRLWVNTRVEEIWSACPAVACRWGGRSPQRNPEHSMRGAQTMLGRQDPVAQRQAATAVLMQDWDGFARDTGFGIERH